MATGATSEDRAEILDLYARYAHTIDNARFEEWLDCFTIDGVFESATFGRHSGREALRKFCATYQESWQGAQVRHHMTTITFAVEGDSATGGCYLSYYHCKGGKIALSAVGHYTDTLRKEGGRWKFTSRRVALDASA
ncbi:MAG: nuclear transport factor 2 family protein [Candidatus Binataceae bacterium]